MEQRLLPHLLQSHRHLEVAFTGVIGELKTWPALAIRVPCLGQEFPGLLDVVVEQLRRLVAECTWGCDAPGGRIGAVQYGIGEALPVYRHGQSPSHAHIVQRRLVGVEQVVVGTEIGGIDVWTVLHGTVDGNLVQWNDLRVVQLAHTEHALLGGNVFRGVEHDAVQLHAITIPIGVTLLDENTAIQFPVRQAKWSVADHVLDSSPGSEAVGGLAVFFDGGSMNRVRALMIQQLYEVGRGRVQFDLQRVFIQRFNAYVEKIVIVSQPERETRILWTIMFSISWEIQDPRISIRRRISWDDVDSGNVSVFF